MINFNKNNCSTLNKNGPSLPLEARVLRAALETGSGKEGDGFGDIPNGSSGYGDEEGQHDGPLWHKLSTTEKNILEWKSNQ